MRRDFGFEGIRLQKVGIEPGQHDGIEYDTCNRKLCIKLSMKGDQKIYQRKRAGCRLPLVDINNIKLSKTFDRAFRKLRVIISVKGIVVTLHHHLQNPLMRFQRLMSRLQLGEPMSAISPWLTEAVCSIMQSTQGIIASGFR